MFNKEKIKWIAVFSALALLFVGVISALAVAINNKPDEKEEKQQEIQETVVSEASPMVALAMGSAKVMSLSAEIESAYVSQTVTATISPSTVVDKYVTWSVAWASDAALKNTDISDYIQITEESQGELTATINCYKAFKGSKAVLTCATRQGGKTTTINVVYEGVPSSMTINAPSGVTKHNLGKDSVDLLYVGKSYSLNLAMDNIFHNVGNNFNDFNVTVSGVGTVQCGTYSASPRGAYWYSDYNTVDFSGIAKEFVTCTTSGNTLTINVTKSLYDYYESSNTEYKEQIGDVTTYTNKLKSLNTDSDGNLPYIIVTVSHKTYGFSAQYKFFIGEEISSVSANKDTVIF